MKTRILDSVRVRLTLWYVSILAFVLVVFSVVVYELLSRSLNERVDDGLRSVVAVATVSLTHDTEEGQTRQGAAQSTLAELFNQQQVMAIFDESGTLLARNEHVTFYPGMPDPGSFSDQDVHFYTESEKTSGDHYRVALRRVLIPPANTPYLIVVSQSLRALEQELETLREILIYVVPVALLMAGVGGWFLARKSLAPVVAMSERARLMGAGDFNEKLPVANPRDELGQLATTFNELLGRLSAAFSQQRMFMADASHEMRTPLSVIHITAGVTLEQPHRDEMEYRESIKTMDEQTQRLTRIVEDMFTLARADSGRYPLHKSRFYIDELIDETARAASVLASGREVTVGVINSPDSTFFGDEDLLRRMILNLLDNAIKHSRPAGSVRLRLTRHDQEYNIEVSDTGTGIPPESQPSIFERFYRADKARSRSDAHGGGAGLGLSISRWVAEAHGGSLRLAHSDNTGTTFVATLPIRDSG
jgi:two-component system, OmpR family, sensor kinase